MMLSTGFVINVIRRFRGMTQVECSRLFGKSDGRWAQLENESNIKPPSLSKCAGILNVPVYFLNPYLWLLTAFLTTLSIYGSIQYYKSTQETNQQLAFKKFHELYPAEYRVEPITAKNCFAGLSGREKNQFGTALKNYKKKIESVRATGFDRAYKSDSSFFCFAWRNYLTKRSQS